jgi:hypothetical protein
MDLIEHCQIITNINLHKINYKIKIYQCTYLLIACFSRCNARTYLIVNTNYWDEDTKADENVKEMPDHAQHTTKLEMWGEKDWRFSYICHVSSLINLCI